jgi:UDP-N-acetylglucosamine diphosphorylase / glucose-1-phosphate thymidylyltransferase / UDP-N-acetylgalactosamine diphosphorylase / glucosamine-1-phosphate N-acetyltransferase / galactosamine-1-phosphate N-acetyltransferase
MLTLADLTDLDELPVAWRSLADVRWPWEVLERLDALVAAIEPLDAGDVHPSAVLEGPVRLEPGSRIGPHAHVQGPAWLMRGAEVGHAAFVRGGVLMGEGAKVGHASEVKRSVLLAGAKVPHFNYVGDSFVGRNVNLGAGVKCANLKATGGDVTIDGVATGLRKLGALLGDDVSVGCNAVLAPGTIIGAGSVVYQSASVRGVVPPRTLVKVRMATELVALHER